MAGFGMCAGAAGDLHQNLLEEDPSVIYRQDDRWASYSSSRPRSYAFAVDSSVGEATA